MLLFSSFSHVYMGGVVPFAIAMPLATGLYHFKHLDGGLKVFVYYLLLQGVCNTAAALLAWRHINNMPLLHIYTPAELALLLLFYRRAATGMPLVKYTIAVSVAFAVFCMVNALLLQSIYGYNSYAKPVSGIIIMVYALFYFRHVLDAEGALPNRKVCFWLNTGILLYFGGSFFLFAYANFIIDNLFLNTIIWNVHATLVLIMYILFTTGMSYAKSK